VQLARDVNPLRTVARTLVAADATCSLSQLRDCSVVAYQICPAGLLVILIGDTFGYLALVDTFVIVQKYSWNIDSVWTRHTIFAVIAWDCRIFLHQFGCFLEEREFVFGERDQRRVCGYIVLKMLHIGHSAENCEYSRMRAGETERP
jgi:hypothetical protein